MQNYQLYTDDALLTLLKIDDGQAFNEVYNRYWKMLFSLASSRLRNTHTAEDIIHDVFASLWKNRKNADIRSLQHYLASSTRYLVFKVIRKNAHAHQYAPSDPDIIFEPENSLHNKYLLEFIAREVDTLPEKCRMVFKYSREKGLTNKEIALEMNITSKTVENQINKALHHLRFSMKKILMML
ncbi:RNA polymerase subunit sigma-70 [Terrimonas sp.]|uniref:RNA polymerase sigma factor n=1 Tax=Terrimonas sp. TaxID=1914338 RepID=UPI000D512053|nr:sigma-70 family RNA polymerase sigma factor [Terrimonas sp.]PVD52856.1 RNA polymerase subunit sigma-70 [Terrimonas sp.]